MLKHSLVFYSKRKIWHSPLSFKFNIFVLDPPVIRVLLCLTPPFPKFDLSFSFLYSVSFFSLYISCLFFSLMLKRFVSYDFFSCFRLISFAPCVLFYNLWAFILLSFYTSHGLQLNQLAFFFFSSCSCPLWPFFAYYRIHYFSRAIFY